MKKISFAFTLSCIALFSLNTSAEIYFPKSISIGDDVIYDAGSIQNLTFVDSGKLVGNQRELEYGVVKTIKDETITSYETISSETISLGDAKTVPTISVKIPNITAENATGTYAVYVKFFEKHNPENENFYASKEFSINANETPFIYIKNVNLIQSNGKRFSTLEGPSIYSPEDLKMYAAYNVATSTSLEITFESNQDTVISPKILFSKIRSDSLNEEYVPESIKVKKGVTYIKIPLPVFKYVPGVYIGDVSFGSDLIKNTVQLQYIVAGDSVSVGTIDAQQVKNGTMFDFKIFATPTDVDLTLELGENATTTNSMIYTVQVDFLNSSDKVVYTSTQNVDFAGQNFQVKVPNKMFQPLNMKEVHITVISSVTGKVVYESTKPIEHVSTGGEGIHLVTYTILFALLVILTIFGIFKRKIPLVIVCVALLIGLFFVRDLFAGYVKIGGPYLNPTSQIKLIGEYVDLYIQDDERSIMSGVTYACKEDIQITYKLNFIRCSNRPTGAGFGISSVSLEDAKDKSVTVVNGGSSVLHQRNGGSANDGAQVDTSFAVIYDNADRSHYWYKNMSNQRTTSVPQVAANTSNRYIHVSAWHEHGVVTDHNPVADPLRLLSFPCGGKTCWVSIGSSQYTFPISNSCGISKCACQGRTEVCSVDGIESKTLNSPSCALKASCTFDVVGSKISFTQLVTNALGAVTYKDVDSGATILNPHVRAGTPGQTIVQKTLITDTDGSTVNTTCSAKAEGDCTDDDRISNPTLCPALPLQASCVATQNGTKATFNITVTNAVGAVTYKNADNGTVVQNPSIHTLSPGEPLVQRILVTDSNKSTVTTQCSVRTESANCRCNGNVQVCYIGNRETSRTANSPVCNNPLQATCSASMTGTTATITNSTTNAVGAVTYKDVDSGATISNPHQRQVASGETVVQRTLITDSRGSSATTVCPVTNGSKVPVIYTFKPVKNPVKRRDPCQYAWTVENVDRCSLIVNDTSVLLQGDGLTGPIDVSTVNGNNQRATLTCVADALPANQSTVSSTTLCQVLPEVIER